MPAARRRNQKDRLVVLVYVTLNTLEEGQRLAQLLIARHLTNCVNFHSITCTYLWEGQITTEPEVVALIKTQAEHFDAIAAAVKETVPYTNFVGQLEVTRVNEAFAAWLESVVGSEWLRHQACKRDAIADVKARRSCRRCSTISFIILRSTL